MILRSATSRNMFKAIGIGLIATVATASVMLYIFQEKAREAAIDNMRVTAALVAGDVEQSLGKAGETVNGLRRMMLAQLEVAKPSRETTLQMMRDTLRQAPGVFASFAIWEENTFDGRDKDFVSAPLHDSTGRFVPYMYQEGSAIKEVVTPSYADPTFAEISRKMQPDSLTLLEPYEYPIGDKKVLMTSISTPIYSAGRFLGVTGIDFGLATTAENLGKIQPMGTGYIALLSANGIVAYHPDEKLVGKPLDSRTIDVTAWTNLIQHPGEVMRITQLNGDIHMAVSVDTSPFPGANWRTVVSVPEATVFAHVREMMWYAAFLIGGTTFLVSLVSWLLARRFVRRIGNIIDETTQIAAGVFDIKLADLEKNDEIGDLARSLGILIDSGRHKIELEQETERARKAQEIERVERARLERLQEDEVTFVVSELARGLARLSDGDVTVRLQQPFTQSLDEIRGNFNDSIEKLQAALISFVGNATTIQNGSWEIRGAADDLARRTEHQAASVEETAAALDEIAASVRDSTHFAEEAGHLVERTHSDAERSSEVVRSAIDAMSEIERSSVSISNITGVIDEIAFQTNLLALNAGVEAARAGEAGKGFAVVAQEVRELAQRSANAAKEIKALIAASGDQVKRGVSLVDKTGDALSSIATQVQNINLNVKAIVQAAREQAASLQEISSAVNVIDQGTQANAAMVEQTNAAAHTLVTEVTELSSLLSQFRLGTEPQFSSQFALERLDLEAAA